MPRNPVDLYDRLVAGAREALGTPDVPSTRRRLWTALKPDRIAEEPALAALLSELAIGPSYARNHLLSIGSWPDEVVAQVRDGLALAVARRLAGVDPAVRTTALLEAERSTDLTGTWSQRVAVTLDRASRAAAAPRSELVDGWLPPSDRPDRSQGPTHDVWRFPALSPAGLAAEELHPELVRAILARYASAGDRIVDLTAGAGTVGRVARERGCPSWSSDLSPRAAFVHEADATDLRFDRGLRPHAADLAFLHPPTYYAWSRERPEGSVEGREGYADLVARMVLSAARTVRPGGRIVLVGRPVRRAGEVHTAIGDLQNELEGVDATLIGYHLGVDEAGQEDWHVLVGRLEREHEGVDSEAR